MEGLSSRLREVALASCLMLSIQVSYFAPPLGWAASPGEPGVSQEAVQQQEAAETSKIPEAAEPQLPAPRGEMHDSAPSEVAVQVQKELLQSQFAYNPKTLPDPFKPFIASTEAPLPAPVAAEEDLEAPPPEPQRPLTPLQKMRMSEIEAGLKAIMWGPLGRKAVIEDASGKGYIVSVGTPVGERNGVVTEIFNDHLVIQQEFWDKREKRSIPQNVMVKLKKISK